MKRSVVACFLAFCLLLMGVPAVPAEQTRALTLMIYLCGSNLESGNGSASADIQEMVASGFDSSVMNVLVMAGGTTSWSTGLNAQELSICEVGKRGMRVVSRQPARSMGTADTLRTLIDHGVENYPAENYALILWDHGGGPLEGVCWDELFSMENLTLDEVQEALAASTLPGKLAFIGFDACLMGSAEVAAALSPYAEVMIASQETEPASGWDYSFLKEVEAPISASDIGRSIVDAYFDSADDDKDLRTLACIDLAEMGKVASAMDTFFTEEVEDLDMGSFSRVSEVRFAAGDFGAPVRAAGEEGYDLTDLRELAQRMDGSGELLDALSRAVVYSRSNEKTAHGLSVYHPFLNKRRYQEAWGEEYRQLDFSDGYARYVGRFAALLTGEADVEWKLPAPELLSSGDAACYGSRLTQDQIDRFSSARLLVLRQVIPANRQNSPGLILVWSVPATLGEDGILTAEYRGELLYLEDENGEILAGPVSYMPDEDGETFILPALYAQNDGDKYLNVRYFGRRGADDTSIELERTYVFDRTVGSYTNRLTFSERDYDHVYFWRPIVQKPEETGELPGFGAWEEHPGASMPGFGLGEAWRPCVRREQSTGARTFVAFEVTDVQQNVHSSPLKEMEDPEISEIAMTPSNIEEDDLGLSIAATMYSSPAAPRLEISMEALNLSERPFKLSSGDLVLNGRRITEDKFYFGSVEPGQTSADTVSIAGLELYGIEGLEELTGTLTLSDAEDPAKTKEISLALRFENCDVGALWRENVIPLASGESEQGVSAELLQLGVEWGDLTGRILLKNGSNEALDGKQMLAINGVMGDGLFSSYLAPGMERLEYIGFEDAASVTWQLSVPEEQDSSYLARMDALLETAGFEDVRDITLYFGARDGEGMAEDRLTLGLKEPYAIDMREKQAARGPSLAMGSVKMDIVQTFLASDGLALGVVLENDTALDQSLSIEGASLIVGEDSIQLMLSEPDVLVPAGIRRVKYLIMSGGAALTELPDGAAMKLRLNCSMNGEKMPPVSLGLPTEAVFGAPNGMTLSGEELELLS